MKGENREVKKKEEQKQKKLGRRVRKTDGSLKDNQGERSISSLESGLRIQHKTWYIKNTQDKVEEERKGERVEGEKERE